MYILPRAEASGTVLAFELPLDVALDVPVGDLATAVATLLAPGQREFHLCLRTLEVDAGRDQRQALLPGGPDQPFDLAPVEQQLARALGFVVVRGGRPLLDPLGGGAVRERERVRAHQPLVRRGRCESRDHQPVRAGVGVPELVVASRVVQRLTHELRPRELEQVPDLGRRQRAVIDAHVVDLAVEGVDCSSPRLLVADDQVADYEALFEIMCNDSGDLIPSGMSAPFKEYLNDYVTVSALKVVIKDRINSDGSLIVNYSGHGSTQIWAHDMFTNGDVADLNNGDKLSFFVSMTCLNGFFTDPEFFAWPCLAEVLMRSAGKGAVAAFMSTGMTVPEGQHILDVSLFDGLFTKDMRKLGPAISYAKQMLLANGLVFEDVSKTFVLFGDPAMALSMPLPSAPTGLTAQYQEGCVELSWQSAGDCDGNPVSGYNIYRSSTAGGPYEKVNAELLTETEYRDSGATSGRWYYVVTSVDGDGDESVQSAELGVLAGSRALSGGSAGGAGGGGQGCFIGTIAN